MSSSLPARLAADCAPRHSCCRSGPTNPRPSLCSLFWTSLPSPAHVTCLQNSQPAAAKPTAHREGLDASSGPTASWKRAASLQAELLEHHRGGAEAGECGLEHVQADEGAQQQPIRRDKPGQHETHQQNCTSKGEYCAVDVHGESP